MDYQGVPQGSKKNVPTSEERKLYVDKTIPSPTGQHINSKTELQITDTAAHLLANSAADQEIVSSGQQIKEKLGNQTPNIPELVVARSPGERDGDEAEQHLTDTPENKITDISNAIVTEEQEENLLYQNITFIQENHVPSTTEVTPEVLQSDMDRVTRSMIFSLSTSPSVENLQEQPEPNSNYHNQKDDGNSKTKDLWVPPADRESRLRLVKENYLFDIRAYRPETSPTKLFSDDEDEITRPHSREFTPEKVKKLEGERREIIKRQGQRKSFDTEEVNAFQDEVDTSHKTEDMNGLDSGHDKRDVDTEQINFETARQQFVMLEKKRNSLPISPRIQPRPSRLSSRFLQENDWILSEESDDSNRLEQELHQNDSHVTPKKSSSQLRQQFFWQSSLDDVDSGVEEKPGENNREGLTQETLQEYEDIPNPTNETPIEREIRIALEREESLRKERGILSVTETNEMVEIPKNPMFSMASQTKSEKKSKDRARNSFFLKREIEKEAKREADLKSEGKESGIYDQGSIQELDERRKRFEQPDELPVMPQQAISKITSKGTIDEQSTREKVTPTESIESIENWNEPSSYSVKSNWNSIPYRNRRQSSEDILGIGTPSQPSTGTLNNYRPRSQSSEDILDIRAPAQTSSVGLNSYRLRRQSYEDILDAKIPPQSSTEADKGDFKVKFHFQPWKAHFHVNGDEELDGGQQRIDKESGDADPREMYNISRLRPSVYNVIDQDIQQTLERDRELQEQRRKSEMPPVSTVSTDSQPNTPISGFSQYDRSSQSSGVSSQRSLTAQKGTPSSWTPSYTVPPIQMFRPRQYPKFVVSEPDSDTTKRRGKEESRYAGIEPVDDVNTEIVESTRVIRHKNTMALRWEAGLYSNEQQRD
ncbi:mitotic interactor and substrate of PLK1 isoform 2-T3 [Discoglossus pictus]